MTDKKNYVVGMILGPEGREKSKLSAVGYWKGWELKAEHAESKNERLVVFRIPSIIGGPYMQEIFIRQLHEMVKKAIDNHIAIFKTQNDELQDNAGDL